MTRLPDESISFQNTVGDSGVENLYVYGKLTYDFQGDDITVKSINVTSPSTFSGDVTFTGDITLDEITCRNADVTGVATVRTSLYVDGNFYDASGDVGNSGQLLSSTGSGTNWIDANTTSVANSINVGTNVNSTNADQFITFVGNSSGNNPIRVDTDLKYNPSTNRLTAGSFAGDGSALTGIESFVTGMIILWYGNTGNIPTGFVLCDGNNSTPDLRDRFIVGAGSAYSPGDTGGANSVTLTVNQIPAHTHTYIDQYVAINNGYRPWPASNNDCGARNVDSGSTGGGQSHENRPPYYALCYIMKT
tara:strand:- start:66 stop:980 length:915 start_codon:yes stop_codon:yes gene_type:complete